MLDYSELGLDAYGTKDISLLLYKKPLSTLELDSLLKEGGINSTSIGIGAITGLNIADGAITPGLVNIAMRGWTLTSIFSSTDADTVAWAAGTFTASDGTAYSIGGGNTGNIAALTYIYLDINTSTTALQTTTTAATSVGDGKVLIAVAKNNSDATSKATFQVFGGSGGNSILVDNIVANSAATNTIISNSAQITVVDAAVITTGTLSADRIGASSITSDKINVATLSAISANIGTITAGSLTGTIVTGGTVRTAASGARTELKADIIGGIDGMVSYDSNGTAVAYFTVDNSGNFSLEGSDVYVEGDLRVNNLIYAETDELLLKCVGTNKIFFDSTTNDSGTDDLSMYPHYGDFYATGTKYFRIPHPDHPEDGHLQYVSIEAPEVALQIRGRSSLKNGGDKIVLPHHWELATIDLLTTVSLTPMDNCNGLYVSKLSNLSFEVKELNNGQSNIEYCWVMQAVRKGYEHFNPEQTIEQEAERTAKSVVAAEINL